MALGLLSARGYRQGLREGNGGHPVSAVASRVPKSLNGEHPVATAPNEIEEIRRHMAQIRRELHEDVQDVVAGAEAVADWRRYLRMYPWAAVGLAFAAGYLIVPKRRRSVPRDVARQVDVAEVREAIKQAHDAGAGEKKRGKSLIAAGLGMLAPLAWRAAQNYALSYLEQWIAQQQQHYMAATGPTSGVPPSSGGQGWPGPPGRPGSTGRPGGPRSS